MKPTTDEDVRRIQSAEAKANGGKVQKGGQAARMQSARDKKKNAQK